MWTCNLPMAGSSTRQKPTQILNTCVVTSPISYTFCRNCLFSMFIKNIAMNVKKQKSSPHSPHFLFTHRDNWKGARTHRQTCFYIQLTELNSRARSFAYLRNLFFRKMFQPNFIPLKILISYVFVCFVSFELNFDLVLWNEIIIRIGKAI